MEAESGEDDDNDNQPEDDDAMDDSPEVPPDCGPCPEGASHVFEDPNDEGDELKQDLVLEVEKIEESKNDEVGEGKVEAGCLETSCPDPSTDLLHSCARPLRRMVPLEDAVVLESDDDEPAQCSSGSMIS